MLFTRFGRDPRSCESRRAGRNLAFLSHKQRTILPIFRRPNFTKFEHNTSTDVATKPKKNYFFFNLRLVAITPQWLQINENLLPNDPSTGCLVSIVPPESIQSFLWPVRSVQETSPNFLQHRMRFGGMSDNSSWPYLSQDWRWRTKVNLKFMIGACDGMKGESEIGKTVTAPWPKRTPELETVNS